MAEPRIPSAEEMAKEIADKALDEFEYKGMTIRQWADKITSGECVKVYVIMPIDNSEGCMFYIGNGDFSIEGSMAKIFATKESAQSELSSLIDSCGLGIYEGYITFSKNNKDKGEI